MLFIMDNYILWSRRRLDVLNYARKLVCGELTGEDLDDSMEDTDEVLWLEFFHMHK